MRGVLTILAGAMAMAIALPATASAARLRPLWLRHGTYGESYTFIADLDDGTYLHLSLGFTNLGPGPTKGLCRAVVVSPNGVPWTASTRVGRSAFEWRAGDGADQERLRVGPCSAWIDAAATGVEIPLDGGSVKVLFAARPSRRLGPETSLLVENDRYETEVLLHHVPVTATLALPREPPRTASGGGFFDHTRSTVAPLRLARRWVRFRSLRGDRQLMLLAREGLDGQFTPLWACEGSACRTYEEFRVERAGEGPRPSFRIHVASADDGIDIRSDAFLYRDAPLEELGLLAKVIIPFTGNPVTYLYRGSSTERGRPPAAGILEVQMSE